jgi:hypothetical protein
MRWQQRTYCNYEFGGSGAIRTFIETYEAVYPFRKFDEQISYKTFHVPDDPRCNSKNPNPFILDDDIDLLVIEIEKLRAEKKYQESDIIRNGLLQKGIVIRNGKDWYPKLFEEHLRIMGINMQWQFSMSRNDDNKNETFEEFIKGTGASARKRFLMSRYDHNKNETFEEFIKGNESEYYKWKSF